MRVGRAALDEDAIRQIEEHNPDVAFDWTRILKGEGPLPEVRPRQEVLERRPRQQRQRGGQPPASTPAAPQPQPSLPAAFQPHAVESSPVASEPVQIAPVPAFDEDGTPTDAMAGERSPESPETAAMSRLGAEGLLRLRARHAEVLARISEKVTDPARRDELKLQAERLNPDTWVTDAEVTAGLEQYEAVFESLRAVVGRRRKRRRRRSPGAEGVTAPGEPVPESQESENGDEQVEDL